MKNIRILSIALLSLVAAPAAFSQIAKWTFETSIPATAGPFSPEVGSGSALGSHAGPAVYSSPSGNGSTHSFSSTNWAVGDYYQFSVSTVGQSGITVSFDQTASNTGPKDHKLQYSTDGSTFTDFGSPYALINDSWSATTPKTTSSYSFDLSSITALNNASTVYFRLVDTSTVAVNGGAVASTGTCRVDNFTVGTGGGGGGGPVGITTGPSSRTNNAGTTATFTVTGSNIVSYLWLKNGSADGDGNAHGNTASTLTITNCVAANAASYQVVVSDNTLSVTSSVAVLTVNDPAINTQPASQSVLVGTAANFSVTAGGTPTLAYQWSKDGGNIANATDSTYSIPTTIAGDAGSYAVVVTNTLGSVTSSVAALTVVVPQTDALPFSANASYSQNFDTLANTGTANGWIEDTTLHGWYASTSGPPSGVVATYRAETGSGTAGALYSFGSAASTDRALGSLASSGPPNLAYGLRFTNDHPTLSRSNIVISYTGEEWRSGGNLTNNVLAFSYRISNDAITSSDAGDLQIWTAFTPLNFITPTTNFGSGALDGNNAANRTTLSATLTNIVVLPGKEIFFRWKDINDAGSDHAVAIDDLTITSDAVIAVITAPTIATNPQSRTNNATTTATFTVSANGTAPFDYQWRKNGNVLTDSGNSSGSLSPTLSISALTTNDAGSYDVVVANSAGSATSAVATLTVLDPGITTQPTSRTNVVGDTANFFVGAVGTPPVFYQWQKNGANIADLSTVGSLNITNVQSTNAGSYACIVSNDFGVVTSSNATLTILPTPPVLLGRWDFNDGSTLAASSPVSSAGSGTSALVGVATGAFGTGSSSDPVVEVGLTNAAWNTAGYPAATVSNKTAGVRFNISTVNYGGILLTWEERHSSTASKYTRLQYSADGVNFIDGPVITMGVSNSTFVFYSANLTGYAGVNDNPNFAFRFVTEFESTATGTGSAAYLGTSGAYGTGGTIRYDVLNVFGGVALRAVKSGNDVTVSWSTNFPGFNLQQKTNLSSASWSAGPAVSIVGSNYSTTILNAAGNKFYRLQGAP